MTQIFNLMNICQWGMRQTAELETLMTSVERVQEYTDLKEEKSIDSDEVKIVNENWPKLGCIRFKNVSLKYSDDDFADDYVLKDLNFEIKSNVSRTHFLNFFELYENQLTNLSKLINLLN